MLGIKDNQSNKNIYSPSPPPRFINKVYFSNCNIMKQTDSEEVDKKKHTISLFIAYHCRIINKVRQFRL